MSEDLINKVMAEVMKKVAPEAASAPAAGRASALRAAVLVGPTGALMVWMMAMPGSPATSAAGDSAKAMPFGREASL